MRAPVRSAPALIFWPLLMAAAILLGGCLTSVETPLGEWGYDFRLGRFQDVRPNDDTKLEVAQAFRVQDFMTGWHANVGRSLFANEPATLDVVLHQYNATYNARSYALSMEVSLTGRDAYGRVIAATHAQCNAVEQRNLESWSTMWGDFWQQPADQREASPLTLSQRNVTMWQKVMNTCVRQLALEFGNVMAGTASR